MTRSLNLLLVEDSVPDADLVVLEMRRAGLDAHVTRVDTESELREALVQRPWDVVLCDHGLPGFDSVRALRLVAEAGVDAPFVILSGTIGEEAAVEALYAGAWDVVLKSNIARLTPVIERVLRDADNRRKQAQLERERGELQTQLIELNEELRTREEHYRLLFATNPQAMLVYHRDTRAIVTVNDQFVTRYGYTRGELRSMTIKDLVPREDLELVEAFLVANPGGAQPDPTGLGSYGRRHQYKDGTIIDVDVASVNLTLGGRSCRLVLYQDVTERKRILTDLATARDEAVEASNIKSAFLANISHEVRTPMNGVIGMTELLLGTDLTAEQREYAGRVWRSGEQMLGILDDILDISMIEAGHLELDRGDFDLRGTVGETCSISGRHASAKGLRMTVHFDDDVPRSCHGDGRRLAQVVRNLLSNAIKFTSEGKIGVHVSARHTSPEASLVRVEISDTGIGIEPAQLERIFEPFTQADSSTTRLYGGTGLGLTIAREIVEMMGGAISGRSEPSRGSTFWLEVELGVPTGVSPEPQRPDAVVAATPWAGSPLLLVAEDSPVNQVVAARALERCGCRSHLVASGREAVEAFASGDYDAVLMDCQMPGLDGYRATAEMRAMERDSRRTPIIAMTARALAGDHERCIEAGMDDHISKPMHHAELLEKLTRWIPNDRERRLRPAMPASPPRMLSSGAGGDCSSSQASLAVPT